MLCGHMKGLLFVFILFPVMVFGQVRQKAMVDSIKAVSADIQKVSTLINSYPGTKVESIQAADSDGYVTVVVRIRTTEARIEPVTSICPIVIIKTGDIIADKLSEVDVPPIPF